jgi:hypothetical protein
LECEEDDHASYGGQEEQTATEALDHGRCEERPGEIPYLEDTVDKELRYQVDKHAV